MTTEQRTRIARLEAKSSRGSPALLATLLWRLRRTGNMAEAIAEHEAATGRRLKAHPSFFLLVERKKRETDDFIRMAYAVTGGAVWDDDPATRCPKE